MQRRKYLVHGDHITINFHDDNNCTVSVHEKSIWKKINNFLFFVYRNYFQETTERKALPIDTKQYEVVSSTMAEEEESVFVKEKSVHVKRALEEALETELESNIVIPKMLISFSGGGHKSHIYGMGVSAGLVKYGLYEAFTFACGVSGGSWLLVSY